MRSTRALSSVVTLATLLGLCAGTFTIPATAVVEQPTPDVSAARAAERLLRVDAAGRVTVRTGADDVADFVGTRGAPVEGPGVPAAATPVRAASEHLDRYGPLFGVDRPEQQLEATRVVGVAGSHIVKFAQQVDGLPVVGGELAVALDADGALESVNGETTDTDAVAPPPSEPAGAAVRTAVHTTARTHGVRRATSLAASRATRWFYDPKLIGSPDPFGPRPVWRVEVSNDEDIDQLVLIDSATGRVVESVNQVVHARSRAVCDRRTQGGGGIDRPCVRGDYVLADPATEPGGHFGPAQDAEAAFAYAGDTSNLYRRLGKNLTRLIGHDAGDGRKIRLTVNLSGQNAFWNGREAYFSNDFAVADDVVAHELTHGVIQRLSGLAYWYQSGAINESMADVFGEIVDQRNGSDHAGRQAPGDQRPWLLGEDSPIGAIRDMRHPTRLVQGGAPRQPDRMRSRFYFADRQLMDSGGVHINSGVGNKAAFLIADGGTFNGRTIRGIDDGSTERIKTARIYLRALSMLTSGSDYADLGRVLPQACRGLVGRAGITANDCTQVGKAVAATQMSRQPTRATAPEAPRCTPRNAASRRHFFDNMERPARRAWRFGRLWSRLPQPRSALPLQPYATSGRRSLFGLNPDPRLGDPRSSGLTLRRGVRVPVRGRTFLRFDHARLFEHNFRLGRRARYFDGGRVDVSTNRGRSWSNTARLRWVNGPRQQITLGPGRRGFRGFGGDSHGYQSSRLDLSSFAGRTVWLRWTVSGDSTVGFLGWWLDDVEVFTCRR